MGDIGFVISTVLSVLTDFSTMGVVLLGTFMGLIFGSLPGLTATMGVALLIPLTFNLEPVQAIGMMLGTYVGGIAGGAVPAILINIPGTPDAVVTCIDGHPMSKQGKGAEALGWAAFASGIGTFVSWIVLVFFAPWLAKVCIEFSSPEYAALAFFGLSIIAAVSGKSMIKGLIVGMIGLMISFVGIDPIWGNTRFTLGSINLMGGVNLMPALIGFYSIPQILNGCTEKGINKAIKIKLNNFVPSLKDLWEEKFTIFRSSAIGTVIGAIPATGGGIAAYIAYEQSKRFSKDPDSFGQGNRKGVISAEAANNGVCGGALIPLMTLGIPGDSVTAMLLGGLIIHGLQPGPRLFIEKPDIVVGIFTTLLIATVMMVLLQMIGIKIFIRILSIPVSLLSPILVILSLVGSFALRNSFFDVIIAIILGGFGFLLSKGDFPMSPAILGLVLGSMFEGEVRRSLKLSGGSLDIFYTRPVPCALIILAIAVIVTSIINNKKRIKRENEISSGLI
jgi:putative tricarboxylic transport membrane protein